MVAAAKKPTKAKPEKKDMKPKADKAQKPAAAPKKAKPTVQQKAKLLDGKLYELSAQKSRYQSSVLVWDEAHARAGELKKTMEKHQSQLNQIVQDVIDIRNGNYTPPLPFKAEQGSPAKKGKGGKPEAPPQVLGDNALLMPLSSLIAHGMTEAKLESVASAAEGNTIGALEKFLRSDRDWMRKCKGLGEEWIGKLTDALAAFRKVHPVPEADVVLTASEKAARESKEEEKPADVPAASV